MTREEIENTDWAKEFKADSPISYEKGIKYALQENLEVFLAFNCDVGFWQYSICVSEYPLFWMDAKETKEEAIKLCKKMGWKIIE